MVTSVIERRDETGQTPGPNDVVAEAAILEPIDDRGTQVVVVAKGERIPQALLDQRVESAADQRERNAKVDPYAGATRAAGAVVGPVAPDTSPDTSEADSAAAAQALADAAAKASSGPVVADADAVPKGAMDKILAWVGADSDRAQRALSAERDGKDRPSLVAKLAELAGETAAE